MAHSPSRGVHERLKPRAAPYNPQSQKAKGATAANAKYSRSSTLRRAIGDTAVASSTKPRHSATAPSITDTAAMRGIWPGYAAAAARRTAPSTAVPEMMSGADLAGSRCVRARNSSTPPVRVANTRPGKRGPPARPGPSAAPIAPSAAEAEKAAIKPVSQMWARIALAFSRCGLENGASAVGSVAGDSCASMIDTGADASTAANDIAANAAPIACSGIAAIAPTKAAVAPVIAKVINVVNTVE